MPNTTRAKTWIPGIMFARQIGGDFPLIIWQANSSAGSLNRGQFVKMAAGYLVASAIADTYIYGVTLAAAVTSAPSVPVAVGHPNNMFVGQATGSFFATSFPVGCDFALGPPNKVNLAGATTKDLRAVDYIQSDDITDNTTPARVLFFIQASQYDIVSTTP